MPTNKKTTKQAVKKIEKKRTTLSIPVYDPDGKETGILELPKEIFNVEVNQKLLAQYMRVYLANQRKGTASSKTRSEVVGSTRKIYRQKGTGRARHGDIKAPIFVGGGVVGGPKPRDYSLKLTKKQKRKALFSALTLKKKETLGMSDKFNKIEPKTKLMVQFFKTVGLNEEKILLVLPKIEKNNLIFAARNIKNVEILDAKSLNPYKILNVKKLLIMKETLDIIKTHFSYEN